MLEFSPADKITITLEAQQWQHAVNMLGKQPYEQVAFLISEIQRQATSQHQGSNQANQVGNGALVSQPQIG